MQAHCMVTDNESLTGDRLSKICAGLESTRLGVMLEIRLEWKSTLKIAKSTIKRVIQTTTLEWIPLSLAWISTPKRSDP